MFFQGLEHTAIATPNPKRLAEWYVEHLGFVINHTYDGNYFVKAPNGAMLEIIPSEGDPVATRAREFGVRLALGARSRDVFGLVLRRAAILTAAGLAAGTVIALALSRLLENLLFELSATDAATFAAMVLLYTLFAKLVPIISIWELRAGHPTAATTASEAVHGRTVAGEAGL